MEPDPANHSLTKRDIVQHVSRKKILPRACKQQDITRVVQETLDCMAAALATGRRVELRNFGVFDIVTRKARVGRNPKNPGVDVPIPAQSIVKFRPGKDLKAAVAQLAPR